MNRHRPRASCGQCLPEYLLVCTALALALFMPYAGHRPAAAVLASGVLEYLRGLSFVTSIL